MKPVSRLSKIAFLCFFAFLFSQCSNSNGNNSLRGVDPDLDPNNFGKCSQDPNVGSNISSSSFNPNMSKSGYFSKRLQLDFLNSSLRSSAKALARNIEADGVQIYRIIENQESQCQYFSFLDQPTSEAQKSWDKVSGSGTDQSVLLGLFTTYFSKDFGSKKIQLSDPTIMVRHDTQKWTLLHEMNHYLFAKARSQEPDMPLDKDLLDNIRKRTKKLKRLEKRYKQQNSEDLALKMVDTLTEIYLTSLELDARGPLEEFAIESMLVERAQRGEISDINYPSDIRNAFGYMSSNSAEVIPDYEKMLRMTDRYNEKLFSEESGVVKRPLAALEVKISDTLYFINQKLNNAYSEQERNLSLAHLPFNQTLLQLPEIHVHHFDVQILKEKQSILAEL